MSLDKGDLRERMLKFWIYSLNKKVEIKMGDTCVVTGNIIGVDGKQSNLLISHLTTPTFTYPEGLIRMSDVEMMKFMNQDTQ